MKYGIGICIDTQLIICDISILEKKVPIMSKPADHQWKDDVVSAEDVLVHIKPGMNIYLVKSIKR